MCVCNSYSFYDTVNIIISVKLEHGDRQQTAAVKSEKMDSFPYSV